MPRNGAFILETLNKKKKKIHLNLKQFCMLFIAFTMIHISPVLMTLYLFILASSMNVLEMEILRPYSRPTE